MTDRVRSAPEAPYRLPADGAAPPLPMPLRAHHLPPRSIAPSRSTRAVADIPFDALVYLLAEGVADAQTALDAHTAATLETLAETAVDVVPRVTRTVETDGSITTEAAPPESRSLLELGLTPARYRFSDATIEVEIDVSVTDEIGGGAGPAPQRDGASGDDRDHVVGDEPTDRLFGLRADTGASSDQRRFDREVGANARLAARLEPTPVPMRLESTADPRSAGDRRTTDGGGDAN